MNRRERTRKLIKLGGLVAKAGLLELTNDDRAVLYGAFLVMALHLQSEDRERFLNGWRERGRDAFAAEDTRRSAALIDRRTEPR